MNFCIQWQEKHKDLIHSSSSCLHKRACSLCSCLHGSPCVYRTPTIKSSALPTLGVIETSRHFPFWHGSSKTEHWVCERKSVNLVKTGCERKQQREKTIANSPNVAAACFCFYWARLTHLRDWTEKNKDKESQALVEEEAIKGDVCISCQSLECWSLGKLRISLTVAHPDHLFILVTICVTMAVIGFQKASRLYSVILSNLQKKARYFWCHHSEKKTCLYLQNGRVTNLSNNDLSLSETLCGKDTVVDSYLPMNDTYIALLN